MFGNLREKRKEMITKEIREKKRKKNDCDFSPFCLDKEEIKIKK